MPVANINLLKGHPREALREIIIGVSDAMSKILEAPEDRLFVWVTEHDHDCWGLSGVPASEALASGDRRNLEMPLVQMTLMEGRPKEQLHAIMAAVTAVVAEGAGCDPKKIRVHVASASPDGWSIGGVPASVSRAAELATRARSVA